MHFIERAARTIATPMVRRLLGRENLFVVRERVARKYIRGSGIEVGGLHAPLRVRSGVSVKYADMAPMKDLTAQHGNLGELVTPDILTDLDSLSGVDDSSQDFVIANHVLEHVENPIRALHAIDRVLRHSGIAFIALADKRYTFDKYRKITSLAHIVRDYEEGPDWSLRDHCIDWQTNVENSVEPELSRRVAEMVENRENIHFHVWDYESMKHLFAHITALPTNSLEVLFSRENGSEALWILKKST